MAAINPGRVIEAYHRLDGNKTAVAEELGMHRDTVRKILKEAKIDKPLHGGRAEYMEPNLLPLPTKGKLSRYILTSAQNNTKVHGRFWENLEAYAKFSGARIMISRFMYNKNGYSAKYAKPGRGPISDDMAAAWFDPRIEQYICDDPARHGSCSWQFAPGLVFCAEMNILPTASRPLSELSTYTRTASGIFPHAKLAMESIPTAKNDKPKFNYTTGTVTHRNYIQKKAGLKADFHHAYAALMVEVNSDGRWWVRQLNADSRGSFFDCPKGADGLIKLEDGEIYDGFRAEGINWGDIHVAEMDVWVRAMNWGDGGVIDALRPKYQFMHDLFSFTSRSHHDKGFGRNFEKHIEGIDSVEKEVVDAADFLNFAHRPETTTIVVSSNHDRHGERWLDEADYRYDMLNSEFFLEAQLDRVRAIKRAVQSRKSGKPVTPWAFLPWALRRSQCPAKVEFLPRDASWLLCGIECGWHGDEGPNGSRGTTQSLLNVGRRVNKGHDHTATIRDGVYSAGACATSFAYSHGPSSHSVSHIVTYPNGKRCIITAQDGEWRG